VGDIHGCVEMLQALLEGVALRPEDTLVFLGDYIDRGKHSKRVVETLLATRQKHANTVCLRGNHEDMLLRAAREWDRYGEEAWLGGDWTAIWWRNGGNRTAKSYGASRNTWRRAIPPAHWEFFGSTALEYTEGGYHFVHAGLVPPGVVWEEPEDPRLWIREPFIESEHDFGRIVVFGHTPQLSMAPLVMPNKICLDTAAVFGGRLTLAVFDPDAEGDARLEFAVRQVGRGA
jgi:serine/threonine protein phosphatase 1